MHINKKILDFTYKRLVGMPDRKQILLVLSGFSFQNKLSLSISISAGIKVVSFTNAFRNEWHEKTQVNNNFCFSKSKSIMIVLDEL